MNWPGGAPGGPEGAQRGAADVEDVDPVAAGIGDERPPERVDGEPARVLQLPLAGAEGAPARAVLVARRRPVADDPVVGVVGDVDAPRRVDRHVVGMEELVGLGALAVADAPDAASRRCRRPPAGGRQLSATISREPVTARPCGRSTSPLGDDHHRARPVGREALDPVVARVGDVDRAVRPDRDPAARARVVAAARAEAELPRRAAAGAPRVQDVTRRRRSDRSGPRRRRRRPSRRGRPRPRRPRSGRPGRSPRRRAHAGRSRRGRRPGSRACTGRRRRPSRRARRRTPAGSAARPRRAGRRRRRPSTGHGSAPGHAAEAAAGTQQQGEQDGGDDAQH